MVTVEHARRLALALPDAVEQDHHGRPSFRVGGKIFATLRDDEHVNVMLDEGEILATVQSHPGACEELWWGKRLTAVRVSLDRVDETPLGELLEDAWARRAPKRLLGGQASG